MYNTGQTNKQSDRPSRRSSTSALKTALTSLAAAGMCLLATPASAQSVVWPNDYGQNVAGFQDTFVGTTINTNWQAVNVGTKAKVYTLTGKGVLKVTTCDGDPNHILVVIPGYDKNNQEVLARFRVTNFGTGDGPRGGIGVAVDATPQTGGATASPWSRGINLHFRDYSENGLTGKHLRFLDDNRAWGNNDPFVWESGVWYWMRVAHTNNAGTPTAYGKIWAADGVTAEPTDWDVSWNYTSIPARTGYAGICAGSANGQAEFECSYFMVKATGLPTIKVAPTAPPPEMANVLPIDKSSFLDSNTSISFSARSLVGLSTTPAKMVVNGVDVTSKLVVTGSTSTRVITYGGPLPANALVNVEVTLTDNAGGVSAQTFNYDTFSSSNLTVEAEDFNFSSGKFIDKPVLSSTAADNNYIDKVGVEGIDEHNPSEGGAQHAYRAYDNSVTPATGESVGTQITTDTNRPQYIVAQVNDPGVSDYNVGWVDAGEWWNYTRTVDAGYYKIYSRLAYSGSGAFSARLDRVMSDASAANQTTWPVGMFACTSTGDGQKFQFFPGTDAFGNDLILPVSGKNTLRVTAITSGFNANFYMFVPVAKTGTLAPYVASVVPAASATSQMPNAPISVKISDRETKVVPSSIKLFVDNVQVNAVTNKTAAGATVEYIPASFYPAGTNITVTLVYSDDGATSITTTNTWTFSTLNITTVIPASYALPYDSGVTKGMSVRLVHTVEAQPNTTVFAEDSLAGKHTINYQGAGYYPTFNFNGAGGDAGNIGGDVNPVTDFGLPDQLNYVMEAVTYIALKPGAYKMNVASDDGYRVTVGAEAHQIGLVISDSAGAVANTDFQFLVQTNGLYPFRLMFEEGTGGNYCDWSGYTIDGTRYLIGNANLTEMPAYRYSSALPNNPLVWVKQPVTTNVQENTPFVIEAAISSTLVTNAATSVQYEWYMNDNKIENAFGPKLTFPFVKKWDAGKYQCVVTLLGFQGSPFKSAAGTLTVDTDVTAPTVSSVSGSADQRTITIVFSEPMGSSASDLANFKVAGLTITGITTDNDGVRTILTTSPQTPGQKYTVTMTGVVDLNNNAVVTPTQKFTAWVYEKGGVLREYYANIGSGTAIADLTGSAKYIAGTPDTVTILTTFESPSSVADNYGQRVFGFFVPDVSGNYQFALATDDAGQLWISTDDTPASLLPDPIATIAGAVGVRAWFAATGASDKQISDPIALEAGKRYFIEAFMKEGGGGDNLAVGYVAPGKTTNDIAVIPGTLLQYAANPDAALITVTTQPADVTVDENRSATFSTVATANTMFGTNQAITYQWYKNDLAISGATAASYTTPLAAMTDSTAKFYVSYKVPGLTTTSTVATLTVIKDNTAPAITAAGTRTAEATNVVVAFNEVMDAASTTNVTSYTVTGAAVTNVVLSGIGSQVVLSLDKAIADGATVAVAGVKDLALNTGSGSTKIVFTADVTSPADAIVGSSANTPGAEVVANVLDNNTATKYLNFDKLNTGFTVIPTNGATTINGIGLTSANDAVERDPASYIVEGSVDNANFTVIAKGNVAGFSGRFVRQDFYFPNTVAYTSYRVTFPTVANAGAANSMQVSEVELLGKVGGGVVVVTPTLTWTKSGSNLVLTYTGKLQSADVAKGPYTDVSGATSPATIPTTGTQKYYRTVAP